MRAKLTRHWNTTANVDEVFIDLCRQIIRKDSTTYPSQEEAAPVRKDHHHRPHRGRRRKKKKDGGCTILWLRIFNPHFKKYLRGMFWCKSGGKMKWSKGGIKSVDSFIGEYVDGKWLLYDSKGRMGVLRSAFWGSLGLDMIWWHWILRWVGLLELLGGYLRIEMFVWAYELGGARLVKLVEGVMVECFWSVARVSFSFFCHCLPSFVLPFPKTLSLYWTYRVSGFNPLFLVYTSTRKLRSQGHELPNRHDMFCPKTYWIRHLQHCLHTKPISHRSGCYQQELLPSSDSRSSF